MTHSCRVYFAIVYESEEIGYENRQIDWHTDGAFAEGQGDGVGFVPEECNGEDSVGIRNVRYRLETMVKGSLSIRSKPGEGTTVTITIPLQEVDKK